MNTNEPGEMLRRIKEELTLIRKLLADGEYQAQLGEERENENYAGEGYVCEHCGETFDSPGLLGGHVSAEHTEFTRGYKGTFSSFKDDDGREILELVDLLPGKITSSQLDEFTDMQASSALSRMYSHEGFLNRENAKPDDDNPEDNGGYRYWLNEDGEEVLNGTYDDDGDN